MSRRTKVSLSQLILAAVCCLQDKNGVSACEIADFIATKRGCKQGQIENMVKMILCRAKNHGILCERKGLYRISERYDDSSGSRCEQGLVCISDSDDECDDECDDEMVPQKEMDTCISLSFSQECIEDNEDEDNMFMTSKKRKCN